MNSSLDSYRLTVVIPAFDEEANIAPTVEEAVIFFQEVSRIPTQVILVDDGSTDGTLQEMKHLSRCIPGVTVISHDTNRGLGAAIYSGMIAASGKLISWLPADGQIPPQNIEKLLCAINNNSIAILSRPEQQRSVRRRILTWGFNLVVRAAISNRYHRYSGVFLIPRQPIASLKLVANTAVQNLAVVEHCVRLGADIVAVEGTLRPRASGISKVANPRTTFQTLLDTISVRRKLAASVK
jgi:glycosyltransferase involved in cell wall biosynthesis